jgi:hypothetical protein
MKHWTLFGLRATAAFAAIQMVSSTSSAATPWPTGLLVYEHVVIVIEENKDYEQIIGNAKATYINGTLRAEGANLTQMYGEEHNSQGNYFWLFSGSNQNVGFDDKVPTVQFTGLNLGAALITKGFSFRGYSEDLPGIGSQAEFGLNAAGHKSYARKHNPWVSFNFGPHDELATACNLRFVDFPTNPAKFSELPTVAIVVPGLKHDMHDGDPRQSIPKGDGWLKDNLDAYYQWAKTHNSLLIVTWDESDDQRTDPATGLDSEFQGLTDPFVQPTDQRKRNIQNRIPTIFAGARIKHGDFVEGKGITHVNILRTLEAMYGLPRSGAQQPFAAAGGITDDYILTDIFN